MTEYKGAPPLPSPHVDQSLNAKRVQAFMMALNHEYQAKLGWDYRGVVSSALSNGMESPLISAVGPSIPVSGVGRACFYGRLVGQCMAVAHQFWVW
eukprot:CAMPEP_0174330870 /NCGR_PEP_ID=MMETSP0810-20121108/17009_1 /TAXON_ID=73025 ORGANISM="Eutreptiella gymnastica-like, Strain CCMP1594" /NCGR_SAMPLE_ID=MMETSP0810 /ASSEMBLY_ACC=CAM_ASM_000659 /LENGTH=95 /DNA_ID=CAMNT_0015446269 /DNA_START=481 /DNA_END=768 /DNA_ORIENTATION=-